MSDNIRRLWQAIQRSGEGKFQPAQATGVLAVESVERDSTGAIVAATGTLDGAGAFTVPMKGHSAAPGDALLVGYPANAPVGAELAYLRHVASDYAGAGLVIVDANLPAPTGLGITSAIVKTPGSITASAVIAWAAVGEKYQPSGYVVSYRIDGGDWDDRAVPHTGGAQSVEIKGLPPGATIDAHARARYNHANADSPPTADVTETLALDDSSPGSVTAIAVDTSVPNALRIKLSVSVDSDLLLGYVYQLAASPTGPATVTTPPLPAEWVAVLAPGTYYVRAYPISKAGVAGTPSPASNFSGPFVVTDQGANLDTTAPPVWNAPTLAAQNVQSDIGGERPQLVITFPAYSYPSDYAKTIVRLSNGSVFDSFTVDYSGGAHSPITRPLPAYGTWQVTLQGEDRAGNRSSSVSSAASQAVSPSGVPGGATGPTLSSVSLGVKVAFTKPANSTIVKIWKATDNAGTGAAVIGQTDANYFLDLYQAASMAGTVYYYRIQGSNVAGDGAISSVWLPGTVGAYDGSNIAVNSMEANVLKAATTVTSLLRTATAGTRWEVEGATGDADEMQIRAYEAVSGADKLRAMLNGLGLHFYTDAGVEDFYIVRDATNSRVRFVSPPLDLTYLTAIFNINKAGGKAANFKGAANELVVTEQRSDYYNTDVVSFGIATPDRVIGLHPGTAGKVQGPGVYVGLDGFRWFPSATDTPDSTLTREAIGRLLTERLRASGGLHAGPMPNHVDTWLHTVYQAAALGTTGGNTQDIAAWQYPSTQRMTARLRAYRGQSGSGRTDARFRLDSDYDNEANLGGGIMWGFRSTDPLTGLTINGTTLKLYWDHPNTRFTVPDGFRVDGTLSKAAGTFDIDHPDPAKAERWRLRHGFVEGPTRGENIYTYVVAFGPRGGRLSVEDSEGKAVEGARIVQRGAISGPDAYPPRWTIAIPLPDYWPHLNERPRAWVQNTGDGWGRAKARVSADLAELVLEAEEGGEYAILLIGTRKDRAAREMWDRRGAVYGQAQRTDNGSTLERRAARLAEREARAGRQAQRAALAPAPAFDAAGMATAMRATPAPDPPTAESMALVAAMAAALGA
jgi:hypothetical protein